MLKKILSQLSPDQKSTLKIYLLLFFAAAITLSAPYTIKAGQYIIGKIIQYQLNKQINSNKSSQKPIPLIAEIDIKGDIKAEFDLIEGWNYIAFPIKPVNFATASDLIKDIVNKGGYVTTVSVWDGDRWQEFSQRGVKKFGFNFNILPGKAYFLKAEKPLKWTVFGDPIQPQELSAYSLDPGWNGVGIIAPNLTAQTVLDSINQGAENATVIDWWWSGDWDLFIKRYYDSGQIEEYGNNFPILNTRGYMILLNQPTTWRLE